LTIVYLEEIRERLQEATNSSVNFVWMLRLDEEIKETYGSPTWIIDTYRDELMSLVEKGDWLGIHPHTETWDDNLKGWILDLDDQAYDVECIDTAFRFFNQALGFPPQAVHFRPFQMSNQIYDVLEKWRCKYDFSLETNHVFIHNTCAILKNPPKSKYFPSIPFTPYQPSIDNFWQSGQTVRDLWIIPLSNGFLPGVEKPIQLNLTFHSSNVCYLMDNILEILERPYLVCLIRSDVSIIPGWRVNMDDTIGYIINHPLINLFQFTTPDKLVKHYQEVDLLYAEPLYLNWLKQRLKQKSQTIGQLEQNYKLLEDYTFIVKNDLELKINHLKDLEAYIPKLEKELALKNKCIEELETNYRRLEEHSQNRSRENPV
jgi:hypothetical protein